MALVAWTLTLFLLLPGAASAAPTAFDPQPRSSAAYGISAAEVVDVPVGGGETMRVRIVKPIALAGGPAVPSRIPVVLTVSPYRTNLDVAFPEVQRYAQWARLFTSHGYAVALADAYGFGTSSGCYENFGPREVEAAARVVHHLGEETPWSNGRLAMLGLSYDAQSTVAVATRADPRLTQSLKAIVPVASGGSAYESVGASDGVALSGAGPLNLGLYKTLSLTPEVGGSVPSGRVGCEAEHLAADVSHDLTGDVTPYWAARDYRSGAKQVGAATLMVHGFADVRRVRA